MSIASDIVLKLSFDGKIMDAYANPFVSQFENGLEHWVGLTIDDILTEESIPKLQTHIASLRSNADERLRVTELNHVMDGTLPGFPVRYTIMKMPGEDLMLLLGKDLTPVAEVQQNLVNAQVALEREYERLLGIETLNRAILDASDDAIVIVNSDNGKIQSVNANAAKFFGARRPELEGSSFAKHFLAADRENVEHMAQFRANGEQPLPTDLTLKEGAAKVTVVPRLLRMSGRIVVMCKMTLTDKIEEQMRGERNLLSGLFTRTPDAIVFTDKSGTITSCNQSFLNICDAATYADVEGRSLAEFLVRGGVDLKIIQDRLVDGGLIKNYAAGILSIFGTAQNVSVSVSRFTDGPSQINAYVFRSSPPSHREPNVNQKENSENFVNLVGSTPLKEIVAGTTDVIEKLCIEAALQITNNNKVAAANLLGLSRQSLYEKIRKYEIS